MACHCTLGLLLLISADFLSPLPGAFSWDSSDLFVDAVVRVAAQREAALLAFVVPARQSIETDVSLRSGVSVAVVHGRFIRGTLRPRIKRSQAAPAPQSPSEDH